MRARPGTKPISTCCPPTAPYRDQPKWPHMNPAAHWNRVGTCNLRVIRKKKKLQWQLILSWEPEHGENGSIHCGELRGKEVT